MTGVQTCALPIFKFYFLCSIKQSSPSFDSKLNASLVMYPSQINHQIPHNSQQNTPQIQQHRQQQQPSSQDSISVQGIPSVTIQNNKLLIGTSQSSMLPKYNAHIAPPSHSMQVQGALILVSKFSVMDRSVLFGSAIGMVFYHQIHLCRRCSAGLVQDQSGQGNVSLQSKG